jgi:hypothetical protein
MPAVYTIEWKDGRKETLFGPRGYYYVFSDRTVLSFLPVPAWCLKCRSVRLCERLHDEASIRQELADLDDPNSARSQELKKSLSKDFPQRWRRRKELELNQARSRRLPPSCIHCGNREIVYFTEGEWAPHPGTGEDVRFYIQGMCSTAFANKFYDLEGNPLELVAEELKALLDVVRCE